MRIEIVKFLGRTHLVSPLGGCEHTLCGVANDAAVTESDPNLRWEKTTGTIVDCPECVKVIEACRQVVSSKP